VRELQDVTELLASGADKVSVGSAGIKRPELLAEISKEHGDQVLVISLDLKRAPTSSGFGVTSHGGRQMTELDALDWVRKVQDLGAGELLVNSIDADGTRDGFDLELIEAIKKISHVPVIASGGISSLDDIAALISLRSSGVEGVIVGKALYAGAFTLQEALELTKR
jgi:cyclase